MIRTVILALLSYWRRQPFQLLTLLLGLSLATALWSGVQAINAEARKSYGEAADTLGGGGLSEIRGGPDGVPIEAFAALRRAGWKVSPVIDGWLAAERGRVRLMGIDPISFPQGSAASGALNAVELPGLIGTESAILAAAPTAERLRPIYGDTVIASDVVTPGLAIADLSAAARLLGRDRPDRLLVAADGAPSPADLAEIDPGLTIETPSSAEDLGRLTDSFHLNLTAFGLLSFAVGLFIVNGAVGLAFEQRRPVFRTLRALGVTARMLVVLLATELLILAVLAGFLGIGLGYLIAALLLPDVAATLRGLYGASVEGVLTLSPLWWLSGIAIACLGTAMAAATGLVRVARLAPLAPAKPRAWSMTTGRAMRRQAVLAGLFIAAALVSLAWGEGLVSGFILLGSLLLAAALVLPLLLSGLLALASRLAKGPLSTWFWADTRQQLPGLSLALMALLLALAANIGVGTMVESFRLTFTGWLDQRLVSDLYISIEEDAEERQAILAYLEDEADALLPIWRVNGTVMGTPADVYGVADHPVYPANWPLLSELPNAWTTVTAGAGALINEQMSRRLDLAPGDTVNLPNGLETSIVGVYSDYGNPIGQVVIALPLFQRTYPEADREDFGILISPDRADALRSALIDEFGLSENEIIDQAGLKSFSLQVFERTFAVTGVLNVLTLGVAGIAILTSLLTLASMRLPQLAPVWALGVTRASLGRIEFSRALILAAMTFLLSVPVGLGLAWVLLAVINVEAFGWRLPMYLFPADWLRLGFLSLVAAGLASLWPALRLTRRPPADLIRVFAAER